MIGRRRFLSSLVAGLLALLAWPFARRGARGVARAQEPEAGAAGDAAEPDGTGGGAEPGGAETGAADTGGEESGAELPEPAREALADSQYVYISPLRSDGEESTCHAEVWYAWLDGAVVITTQTDTWKARAVSEGLDGARIWVGDYGRWKRALGLARNEAFRKGPSFRAHARVVEDPELLDRLLSRYGEKYPEEMKHWDSRMREGHASGKRVLIRYEPVAAG